MFKCLAFQIMDFTHVAYLFQVLSIVQQISFTLDAASEENSTIMQFTL